MDEALAAVGAIRDASFEPATAATVTLASLLMDLEKKKLLKISIASTLAKQKGHVAVLGRTSGLTEPLLN